MDDCTATVAAIETIYRSERGAYSVQLASIGYVVLHARTGARIAWCERGDTARAVADSREWADEKDAET
jgi:hypothetical protein